MKKLLIWLAAIIITVGAAIYQRSTGPTYPRSEEIVLADSIYTVELKRSSGPRPARVILPMKDTAVHAVLYFKRLAVQEAWTTVPFEMKDIRYHGWFMKKVLRKKDHTSLAASMPVQPPAGKLEYWIEVTKEGQKVEIAKEAPVIIRFKGNVPAGVLIPHVILMFLAMLLATVAGLMALFKIERYKRNTLWTFGVIFLGGFIFGPWVQWHAFGEWWTGIPFGWDLTDNKTLFAFLFWIAALWGIRGKGRPWLIILAAVMTLVIFSIPHSLFGSELDYATGVVSQG